MISVYACVERGMRKAKVILETIVNSKKTRLQ